MSTPRTNAKPPAEPQSPPIENILATVLDQPQAHHATECYATMQCFPQQGWHCG